MQICFDGQFYPSDQPVLTAGNRGYRYGEGLFETIRVENGRIPLASLHFDRLFNGMSRLGLQPDTRLSREALCDTIFKLCSINKLPRARVRLSVSKTEDELHCLIENFPFMPPDREQGISIEICPDVRKHYDQYSDLKSANYLPYLLAARFASQNHVDDALVLNTEHRIIESTVANIFLVKGDAIVTPSLKEGCISGVMRRWLMEHFTIIEGSIHEDDLMNADEIFLSNALHGVKWVRQFRDKFFENRIAKQIQETINREVWQFL